jgi:hypothetical protein
MFKTLFISIWLVFHPVHVTLTSIDYIPEMESFNVFVRMYFDDFLLDCKLSDENIQSIDFSGSNTSSLDVMEKYLKEKINIKVNEKQLTGILQDMKLEENEISMNMRYKAEKKTKTISVRNLIMTELYKDQSNMLIVRINDFEEGVKLTSDKPEQAFKIK